MGRVEGAVMEEKNTKVRFMEHIETIKRQIGLDVFEFDPAFMKGAEEQYDFVQQYVMEKQLFASAYALPLVRGIMSQSADCFSETEAGKQRYRLYFQHCLSVSRMLIDLHLPVSKEEEDYVIAAALCHILPENDSFVTFENLEEMLSWKYLLSSKITEIVRLITRKDGMSEENKKVFYEQIQKNKLALLVRLADRGNLVEQLYGLNSWSAHEYIHETRNFFFPMCIYAKEYYPDIVGPVSVLMEKMRCLIEVSEILLDRYEKREQQLSQEILALKEENSRIRGMIRSLKG